MDLEIEIIHNNNLFVPNKDEYNNSILEEDHQKGLNIFSFHHLLIIFDDFYSFQIISDKFLKKKQYVIYRPISETTFKYKLYN